MEYFPISKRDEALVVTGIPDAAKLVRISGPNAKRFADLTLHQWDLRFARDCLEAINSAPPEPSVHRRGLWRMAIVSYAKCFGRNDARPSRLLPKEVYSNDTEGVEVFEYFRDLRHKHIVHDENSYLQAIPGAALNDGCKTYKVERVVCFAALGETLGQENYSNLHLLITKALAWVEQRLDELADQLTAELEAQSYEQLCSLERMEYRKPLAEDVSKTR